MNPLRKTLIEKASLYRTPHLQASNDNQQAVVIEIKPAESPAGIIEHALQQAILGDSTQENTQEKIFFLVAQEPTITRNELAKRLNITPDSVKHHLQKLKQAGRIEHVGPTKSGHWRILK